MLGLSAKAPRAGLHPLVGLGLAAACFSFGMAIGPVARMTAYIVGLTGLVLALGYWRPLISILKFALPAGLAMGLVTWLVTGSAWDILSVVDRFLLFGLTACLTAAINPSDLARALNQARCPRTVSLGFLITVRFIPVLKSEIERILEAVRVRGLRLSRRNWRQALRMVLLPLVVRLVDISDTLALSLETRGFSASGRPSVYRRPRLSWRDWLAAPAALGLIGGVSWWTSW